MPFNNHTYTLGITLYPISLADQLYTFMIMYHVYNPNMDYRNIETDNIDIKNVALIINKNQSNPLRIKSIGNNLFK